MFWGYCKFQGILYLENMAKNMVLTYLHFRVLKFPLIVYYWLESIFLTVPSCNLTWYCKISKYLPLESTCPVEVKDYLLLLYIPRREFVFLLVKSNFLLQLSKEKCDSWSKDKSNLIKTHFRGNSNLLWASHNPSMCVAVANYS